MKTSLSELTIDEFIDMLCGDYKVLGIGTPEKVALVMRDIMLEYRQIADSVGVREYMRSAENEVKAKISKMVLDMCRNLTTLKEYDRARAVLQVMGIRAGAMSDEKVKAVIASRSGRVKRTLEEIEAQRQEDDSDARRVREAFDTQTAQLMTHYKFQIDRRTMMAPIYAHLVARYNEEVRQMLRATKRS